MFCKICNYYSPRLTGISPFHGHSYKEVLTKNNCCEIQYPAFYWESISSEAKNLTKKLLNPNPNLRISAKEALEDGWFKEGFGKEIMLSSAMENMKKYHNE